MCDEEKAEIDWVLVARYLAGEASPAEEAQLRRWIAGGPGRQEELAALRRLWDQASTLPSSSRLEAMWQAIAMEIRAAAEQPAAAPAGRTGAAVEPPAPTERTRRGFTRRLGWVARHPATLRIAAGLAAVAAGVLLSRAYPPWSARIAAFGNPEREFRTEHGQRAEIRLQDGTRVDLGPASTLRVRIGGTGPREAHLEGEAVFDVVHEAKRPFRVHSANGVTEDLGTRFAVRAYPDEDRVQVVVVEGRVALRPSDAPQHSGTILGPGQLGRLDLSGKIEVTSGIDTTAYLAWTRGRLVFDQAPLREVALHLERWYGIAIEIPDPRVAEKRITLDIPLRGLAETLNAVTVPLELRYERKSDSVVIHP